MNHRPYQLRAVKEVETLIDEGKRAPLLVSATGTGKTRMLAEFAYRYSATCTVLWVAPRIELLHQASNALRDRGLVPERDVLVRSNQELSLPGATIPRAGLVIVDEAHHMGASSWATLRTRMPNVPMIGGTATPERGDGVGLDGIFDAIVVGLSTADAIKAGYLVRADILRPERPLAPGELAQDPIAAYLERAAGEKAIFFHPSVELAVQTACKLRDGHGIKAAAVWGDMPGHARARVVREFAEGKLQVLTSVAALTEGFDVPDVSCVVLARGFGTRAGYIQAVGRGLRPFPGKERCLVLDLRGCSHEHGDPDEEYTFHLEGRGIRRKLEGADVRFCPVCGAPVIGAHCEQCGHAGEMRMRPPRVLGLAIDRFARFQADDTEVRAKRLARWIGEARAKGWKEGRAMHRYKGVYQEWPSFEVTRLAKTMAAPTGGGEAA